MTSFLALCLPSVLLQPRRPRPLSLLLFPAYAATKSSHTRPCWPSPSRRRRRLAHLILSPFPRRMKCPSHTTMSSSLSWGSQSSSATRPRESLFQPLKIHFGQGSQMGRRAISSNGLICSRPLSLCSPRPPRSLGPSDTAGESKTSLPCAALLSRRKTEMGAGEHARSLHSTPSPPRPPPLERVSLRPGSQRGRAVDDRAALARVVRGGREKSFAAHTLSPPWRRQWDCLPSSSPGPSPSSWQRMAKDVLLDDADDADADGAGAKNVAR